LLLRERKRKETIRRLDHRSNHELWNAVANDLQKADPSGRFVDIAREHRRRARVTCAPRPQIDQRNRGHQDRQLNTGYFSSAPASKHDLYQR
jgi:hypothetical protein